MRYNYVTKEDLLAVDKGLEVLGRVDWEKVREIDFYVYGITSDPYVLDAAKEAIANSTEEFLDDNGDTTLNEEDITLTEVAVAIPIGDVYNLFGSGVDASRMEFAYKLGDEGVRTGHFYEANTTHVKVNFNKVQTLALADTDLYIDQFLMQEGKGTPAEIKRKVERSEEATAPQEPQPEAPAPTPQPKQTSLAGGLKIADVLEEFLG